jgi:hypothetical protein
MIDEEDKAKSRLKIIAIAIVAIILISATIIWGTTSLLERTESLVPEISVTPQVAWIGEEIVLTANGSRGDIKEVNWDFGDGTEGHNMTEFHNYTNTGWYNVTLELKDRDGRVASTSMTVGAQMIGGGHGSGIDLVYTHPRPRYPEGMGGGSSIVGPNIGNPTGQVEVHIGDLTGTVIIEVGWEFYREGYADEPSDIIVLLEEEHTKSGGEFSWNRYVQPEEFPEDCMTCSSYLYVYLYLRLGRIDSPEYMIHTDFAKPNPPM